MAVDKLVDSTQLDADLTSVANAIRTKGGTSAQLAFPAGFVSAVEAIETGGGGDDKYVQLIKGTYSDDFYDNKLTTIGPYSFYGRLENKILFLNALTAMQIYGLRDCKARIIVLPRLTTMPNASGFNCGCSTFDLSITNPLGSQAIGNCTRLNTLILRSTSMVPLQNLNAISGSLFDSGKSGGILYVPSALISSYQSATNWSTILGYANNQILPIEGSQYENYYADGTPIT